MSIPFHKRKAGCLYLIKNEFDIERSVYFVVRECADEPAMQRSANQRKLARNVVTIGGSGDQQQLNLQAFKEALNDFDAERQRNLVQDHKREVDELKDKLNETERRANAAERDYRQMAQRALAASSETESSSEPIGV